jgi:uncharacterized protein YhfF
MNEIEKKYWNAYPESINEEIDSSSVKAGIAGNEEIADELLSLFLAGKKRAASGLVKGYEMEGEDLPKVGEHWIILDSKKEPKCIVKTVNVEFHQFDKVLEKVALAEGEGEGDSSLKHWIKVHIDFFTPYLKYLGVSDLNKEMVVTEYYELVHK